ncbi:helix-turn-helix transcriptional regulator [Pseudenhygromyxa sp. WMMC2535]|uniref:helix-turn-helix domain-containing protein n=1 Tax=Pseudenhygromyxa sp. WMMC2535 TaxID=2712867 RepID=UPI001556D7CB|nr:helix-turn-helix transcriptional regulator [Pseudenhygromyxa sp. WMMC2535]NVB36458.1 helix-turn-helix transcriptional regulator [Pseudenhygromyxa sp. WMMC2535]
MSDSISRGEDFGRHVRSLRKARGLTQEALAHRSELSADTIRRLERGSFSPSLDTLIKLCKGFDLEISTLFLSFELGEAQPSSELHDLLSGQAPEVHGLVLSIIRHVLAHLEAMKAELRAGPSRRNGKDVAC